MISREDLTIEEKQLVYEIERDSTLYRGLPCGVAVGSGLDHMLMKSSSPAQPVPRQARLALGLLNFLSGVIIGRLSYFPIARDRVINELPEDSLLRAKVIDITQGASNPYRYEKNSQAAVTGSPQQEGVATASPDVVDNDENFADETTPREFTTYESLRDRHRFDVTQFTTVEHDDDAKEFKQVDGSTPLRYNKYGDPIFE